ncbi:MAG: hypothetical protein SFW65_02490 [Alphaproteobacteria bacterium]|nr:hypothetical protein [Alphaproteobacteria bacterium]
MPTPIYNATIFNVSDVTNAADRIIRSGEYEEFSNLLTALRDAPELSIGIEPIQVATVLPRLISDEAIFTRVFQEFKDNPKFKTALTQAIKESSRRLGVSFAVRYGGIILEERDPLKVDTLEKLTEHDKELSDAFFVGLRCDMDEASTGRHGNLGAFVKGTDKVRQLAKIVVASDVTRYLDEEDDRFKIKSIQELLPILKDKPALRAGITEKHITALVHDVLQKNISNLHDIEDALKDDARLHAAFVVAVSTYKPPKPDGHGEHIRVKVREDSAISQGTAWPSDKTVFRSHHPARDFSDYQRSSIERQWDDHVYENKKVYKDQIVYTYSHGASVTITSNSIIFGGKPSNEVIMKGIEHARDNWNFKAHVISNDKDFVVRVMACAELLGVELTHEHLNMLGRLDIERSTEFSNAFKAFIEQYPHYARAYENNRQREAQRSQQAQRSRGLDRGLER